ncbi:hypothetical protein ACSBPQ_14315 [Stenotrophomonas sp. JC08]|uniref:hypothetical protein n=1 Tax=Stenotrophomonas sp. JC08 TaxID=3445779 RepID=UPI003FA26DD6
MSSTDGSRDNGAFAPELFPMFAEQHIPGESLFRNTLVLFAKADGDDGWQRRQVWSDESGSGDPEAAVD